VVMRSRMKEVSKAGGMIIQDFDFDVIQQGAPVFSGATNFGFFTKASLANQVGIRNSRLGTYQLPEQQKKAVPPFQFSPDAPVYPGDPTTGKNTGMPASALRMFDEISVLDFEGGLYQKGYLKAIKTVNPSEWFFDAHFYQDPVCPGSLGIESFLQMLRFFLIQKFEIDPQTYEPLVGTDISHEWIYRGQIVPANKKIEVHAHIKAIEKNKQAYQVVADGALVVDGICIYEMKNYGVAFKKAVEKNRQSREKQLRT